MTETLLNASLTLSAKANAFEAFVESYRDRALRLAFRLLRGDQAAAEDVAQNAFLRAHRALAGFRGDSKIDTWFYRILVREAQRHRRWQAVRRLWNAESAEIGDVADPQPQGDPALRRRISAALDRLSSGQREAFVLVHLEGFSVVETAEILAKAPGTIKSHLHRALSSLRQDLSDLRSTDGPEIRSPGGVS
ncbi:MAG TPA: RNA polymerase sigma factor [Candidatus Acidoferrales bacterium]|nr:RNA polymerase sigma factor [Candidatus Acidoferrales bacterium]